MPHEGLPLDRFRIHSMTQTAMDEHGFRAVTVLDLAKAFWDARRSGATAFQFAAYSDDWKYEAKISVGVLLSSPLYVQLIMCELKHRASGRNILVNRIRTPSPSRGQRELSITPPPAGR